MPEKLSARESIEHVEHAHHLLQGSDSAILRFVPLAAAILAIFAGLASLYAGRLTARVLTLKNEALLHQAKASDAWSQYQAESLKAHLYEIAHDNAPKETTFASRAQKYRSEQPALGNTAHSEETARDEALNQSTALEIRKTSVEAALAFFEVAIVLTSIAAMVKRQTFFWLAGALGALGLFFALRGIGGGL